MKVAYLVFAYRNPLLLGRAIRKLSSKDSAFFIHIDQKSDIAEFAEIQGENVFFSPERIPVYWGEFSGVEAISLLLRQAMASPRHFDYFVLLSGSEYPLRSATYIETYLEEHRGAEFISLVKVPARGKPLSRITTRRPQSNQPARRLLFRTLAKAGLATRNHEKYLGNLEPYAGNTWWALSREACREILQVIEKNGDFVKFFRDVFAPEEAFFHTIVGNSSLRGCAVGNLVFEDWSEQGARPKIIDEPHFASWMVQNEVKLQDVFGDREALFARKFSDTNLKLLDAVDRMIEAKEHRPVATQRLRAGTQ
ncbi:MAG TPA: beta-1,6-N-acetylglucosaminyltransferase [Terracidiphilus sp.]